MKKTASVIFMCLMTDAHAQTTTVCHERVPQSDEILSLPFTPNNFFRMDPDARWATFASPNGNRILRLSDRSIHEAPGMLDAILIGNSNWLTVPLRASGLNFFPLPDILNNRPGAGITSRRTDALLQGDYQSAGQLDPGEHIYRIIAAREKISFGDYVLPPGTDEKQIRVLRSGVLCEQRSLKLPMISKDGQELAALNLDTHSTQIFHLGPNAAECRLIYDFEQPVGKVDFSFDGQWLTFHSTTKRDLGGLFFRQPVSGWSMNLFSLHQPTGTLYQLSDLQFENAYFPTFTRDGSIFYLRTSHQENDVNYHLMKTRADRGTEVPFRTLKVADCSQCGLTNKTRADAHRIIVGALWIQDCHPEIEKYSSYSAALMLKNIDRRRCMNLAENFSPQRRATILRSLAQDHSRPDSTDLAAVTTSTLERYCKKLD